MPDTAVHEYRFGGPTRLLALALVVGPIAAAPLVLGEREVRLTCERAGKAAGRDGTCIIEHVRVLAVARQEVPLASVLRARLDGAQSGGTGMVLVTPDGEISVAADLREEVATKMVHDVNAFLGEASQHDVEARAPRGAGLGAFYAALAAALAFLGALAYRSAPRVRVELDASMDAVRVVRRLWPLRPVARSVVRGEVADAIVEGIPAGAPERFRVTLVRKDGGREPLTVAYHAGDRAAQDDLARAIRDFVRAPAAPPASSR